MCNFFSFVTDPVNHPAEYYYFDWEYRKANLDDEAGRLRYEWMDAFVRAHAAKLHGESPQICMVGGVTCAW